MKYFCESNMHLINEHDGQGLWIVKVSCERLLLVNQTPLKRVTSHDRADFNKKFERGFMKKFKSWAEPFSTTFMFVCGDIKITLQSLSQQEFTPSTIIME